MPESLLPVLSALGIILTALVSFLIARWRFGGSIKSTEAVTLWAQADSIREWAMGRIESLETQLAAALEREQVLRERVAKLEAKLEVEIDPPSHLA